jgi:hypothetical protein
MSSYQSTAELAYRLWSARGYPHGSAEQDWLEAERQLATAGNAGQNGRESERSIDASLRETFPASDPPSSHLPDLPPANADEKWIAAGKRPPGEVKSSSKQR